jgi:hypothetical protein
MIVIVRAFAFYPWLLTPCSILLKLDPVYYLIKLFRPYLPYYKQLYIPYTTITQLSRCYIIAAAATEICRLLATMTVLSLGGLQMTNYVLASTAGFRHKERLHLNRCIHMYKEIEVVFILTSGAHEMMLADLLFGGICILALFNLGTFRLHNVLPPLMYSFFPSVSVVQCMMIHIGILTAHVTNDVALGVMREWGGDIIKRRPRGRGMKYYFRKVRSIRPVLFYARFGGMRLCKMRKEFKIKYYSTILDITLNLLLTTPARLFDRAFED